MKKLIVIMVILAIIFVGMLINKNIEKKKNDISIEEIKKIESYIQQIYMWKEIANEILPCFEDINQADENWIWEVVGKNLEEYELSYQKIQEKAKELFGDKFAKEFPKEGTKYLTYDKEKDLYYAKEIELDQQEENFLLNKIVKIENGYEVELVEYLEDYSKALLEEKQIVIKNINGEEIGKIDSEDEEKINEIVKNSIDKLSKKKVILKVENEKMYVEKIEQ